MYRRYLTNKQLISHVVLEKHTDSIMLCYVDPLTQ